MHIRGLSAALLLVLLVLIMGFIAGCGGADQTQGGENGGAEKQQGSEDGGAKKQQGGEDSKKGWSNPKIALGTIIRVNTEARKIVLKPSTDVQGKGPMLIWIKEEATVTLDGEEAQVADIKEGQQAQIAYRVKERDNRDDLNLAHEVDLISADGANPEGGENTG